MIDDILAHLLRDGLPGECRQHWAHIMSCPHCLDNLSRSVDIPVERRDEISREGQQILSILRVESEAMQILHNLDPQMKIENDIRQGLSKANKFIEEAMTNMERLAQLIGREGADEFMATCGVYKSPPLS